MPGVAAASARTLRAREHPVEVAFVGAGGVVSREPLSDCWNEAFERVAPVRGFPSYRGQRNWPGLWWFASTGEHVGYESWVERDVLMAMDADPDVVAVAAQPMWLHWTDEQSGRAVRHAPDFFARRADGSGVVIDVRPDHRVRERDAAAFAATAAICAEVGWGYQRVGELDPIHAANLRWLAGYRHPRCAQPAPMARLREVFAAPTPLLTGATAAGDPVAVLPVLFSMLWHRELVCELTTTLLGPASLIATAPANGTLAG
ncbi:MAG: TnsA-like heteromeric transposase endonuclease subunit [Pseudonocardia sp.]